MFKTLLASLVISAALITPACAQIDFGPPSGGFGGGYGPGGGSFGGGVGGGFSGPGGFSGGWGVGFGPNGPTGGFGGGFGFPGFGGPDGGTFRNPGTPYEGQLPPTATTSVDFDITECSWCGQGGSMISNDAFNQLNIDLSNMTTNFPMGPGGGGNFPGGPGGAPPGFVQPAPGSAPGL
jgi:hypothetical protein